MDYNVFVPEFPTPENQTLKNWEEVFKQYEWYINENSIFVGHSLWVPFLLSILEKLDNPIKTSFFVSWFISLLWDHGLDEINKTFVYKTFDWSIIKNNCKKFHIFHSDNDPYVPSKHAKNLADNLNEEVLEIKNAGHFNENAGYNTFELLLNEVLRS